MIHAKKMNSYVHLSTPLTSINFQRMIIHNNTKILKIKTLEFRNKL
jgi:hypothetical protein